MYNNTICPWLYHVSEMLNGRPLPALQEIIYRHRYAAVSWMYSLVVFVELVFGRSVMDDGALSERLQQLASWHTTHKPSSTMTRTPSSYLPLLPPYQHRQQFVVDFFAKWIDRKQWEYIRVRTNLTSLVRNHRTVIFRGARTRENSAHNTIIILFSIKLSSLLSHCLLWQQGL